MRDDGHVNRHAQAISTANLDSLVTWKASFWMDGALCGGLLSIDSLTIIPTTLITFVTPASFLSVVTCFPDSLHVVEMSMEPQSTDLYQPGLRLLKVRLSSLEFNYLYRVLYHDVTFLQYMGFKGKISNWEHTNYDFLHHGKTLFFMLLLGMWQCMATHIVIDRDWRFSI